MSDVVKNDVVKKAVHDKLVAKADDVDTSDVVLGTKYQTDKTELENKIPDINNLGAKTALTTVENKIPSVSNLVRKTDYNTKVAEIGNKLNNRNYDKYIATLDFNTLAADVFNSRLSQANLLPKKILMRSCRVLTKELLKIKQNTCFLKMN